VCEKTLEDDGEKGDRDEENQQFNETQDGEASNSISIVEDENSRKLSIDTSGLEFTTFNTNAKIKDFIQNVETKNEETLSGGTIPASSLMKKSIRVFLNGLNHRARSMFEDQDLIASCILNPINKHFWAISE
jgi:hypothetical protein